MNVQTSHNRNLNIYPQIKSIFPIMLSWIKLTDSILWTHCWRKPACLYIFLNNIRYWNTDHLKLLIHKTIKVFLNMPSIVQMLNDYCTVNIFLNWYTAFRMKPFQHYLYVTFWFYSWSSNINEYIVVCSSSNNNNNSNNSRIPNTLRNRIKIIEIWKRNRNRPWRQGGEHW